MTHAEVTPKPATPATVASAVLDAIEAQPDAFDMEQWARLPEALRLAPEEAPPYGSQLCAAGWTAHVTGWTLVCLPDEEPTEVIGMDHDGDEYEALASVYAERGGERRLICDVAAKALDLEPGTTAGQGRVHTFITNTIIRCVRGGCRHPSPFPLPALGVAMLRTLRRALRPAHIRIPARRFTAGIAALPPTAREALGTDVTAGEAIAYNRARVATATAVALYRSGYTLPMSDGDLDDAVLALDFPYSVPSAETRAALAVMDADYTVTVTR